MGYISWLVSSGINLQLGDFRMSKIMSIARQFRSDENGAAMVEYTILLGIITIAVIVSVLFVGSWVGNKWTVLQGQLTGH
jgi:pilus assembly protein Flp/PilA